ncbi:MAG: TIGR01548 family HAD-type hydrolase [Proteobacteria bacterium]|nr:TIGR01548 family HAD-type hydrolase [Pseudomonadota bacterium]
MLKPNAMVANGRPYSVPRASAPTDLRLDGNEGPALDPADLAGLRLSAEDLRRYPKAAELEATLGARFGLGGERVLVSAGGDDLIDRCCRVMAGPGRPVVLPVPGFAMTRRYAELAQAEVVEVPWNSGPFPTEACLAVEAPGIIVLTSPNNPTGGVATVADVDRLCAARPDTLILVDAAYAEFADEDLTGAALRWPNAVVIRTLSKAWGLAGLRVGYALGSAEFVGWLRAAGAPYPVSGPSLALALLRVREGERAMRAFVETARLERTEIETTLTDLGAVVTIGQGNFAFARVPDSVWLRDAMAGLGVAIRAFPGRDGLEDAVRISVPGSGVGLQRVCSGLRAALAPDVLLLDIDGVVADVSESYRAAIVATAAEYGVSLDEADVLQAKKEGDANNDWVLTQRLLRGRGVSVELDQVTATFERLVQGAPGVPGLWQKERLLIPREVLEDLARWRPLAAVTGRPSLDARRFLESQGIADLFSTVVCMEDAPAKPSPEPVLEALRRVGAQSGWMVGDTPDDVRAARAAGVVPIGVRSGGVADAALFEAGCARVLDSLSELPALCGGEVLRCAG